MKDQGEAVQMENAAELTITGGQVHLNDEMVARYTAHMQRFVDVHHDKPRGDILIELERQDRWERIMGTLAASIVPAPEAPRPATKR